MSEPELETTDLRDLVGRIQEGDSQAQDELVRRAADRLERLARSMLRRFPNVARWVQSDDVLQNALLRLLRELGRVHPGSTREFYGMAAKWIRRELVDLARHFGGPLGLGANHASGVRPPGEDAGPADPADPAVSCASELERWSAFHRTVEELPTEEREVFSLSFYHGWTQPRIAELFGVDERTVRRRWRAACDRLRELLGGNLPEV